jgi:hypothetical protein
MMNADSLSSAIMNVHVYRYCENCPVGGGA